MHIKKDNIKIQKCLHGIILLQVEIPWRYGARGKKTNNLHLEIIWINNNIMKPNRCSSSDLKNIFRNASNDLHVLYDY